MIWGRENERLNQDCRSKYEEEDADWREIQGGELTVQLGGEAEVREHLGWLLGFGLSWVVSFTKLQNTEGRTGAKENMNNVWGTY